MYKNLLPILLLAVLLGVGCTTTMKQIEGVSTSSTNNPDLQQKTISEINLQVLDLEKQLKETKQKLESSEQKHQIKEYRKTTTNAATLKEDPSILIEKCKAYSESSDIPLNNLVKDLNSSLENARRDNPNIVITGETYSDLIDVKIDQYKKNLYSECLNR